MRHETFGVAQIVRDVDQLQRLLQAERGVFVRDLEGHDAAAAAHLGAGEFVLRVIFAEGIEHAADLLLSGQEIRHLRGVGAMRLHPRSSVSRLFRCTQALNGLIDGPVLRRKICR